MDDEAVQRNRRIVRHAPRKAQQYAGAEAEDKENEVVQGNWLARNCLLSEIISLKYSTNAIVQSMLLSDTVQIAQ